MREPDIRDPAAWEVVLGALGAALLGFACAAALLIAALQVLGVVR